MIADGTVGMAIGTHALFQQEVEFAASVWSSSTNSIVLVGINAWHRDWDARPSDDLTSW